MVHGSKVKCVNCMRVILRSSNTDVETDVASCVQTEERKVFPRQRLQGTVCMCVCVCVCVCVLCMSVGTCVCSHALNIHK